VVDQLDSLIETYNAISALFPDDAPHKNPVTGVSLLDDVRDAMADRDKKAFEAYQYANDLRVAEERLENAALQLRQMQVANEAVLKSIAESQATALPPKYILVPLHCIFCSFQGTFAELKQHSAECQEHPAVKAMREREAR
jgi:hypothetical protein